MSLLSFPEAVHLLNKRLNSIRSLPYTPANAALSNLQLDSIAASHLNITLNDPELLRLMRNPPSTLTQPSVSRTIRKPSSDSSRIVKKQRSKDLTPSLYDDWREKDPLKKPVCWRWALQTGSCANGDCTMRNPQPHEYPSGTSDQMKKKFLKWLNSQPQSTA